MTESNDNIMAEMYLKLLAAIISCGFMVAERISLDNAKKEKLFYFVANVVVYRESDRRCLLLKRDKLEKVHPNKYSVPGGKLEWKDLDINKPSRMNGEVLDYENAIYDLLNREVLEEAGIEIGSGLIYINSMAFIRSDGIPVVLVKFGARYKSGEVKLEEGSFTDYVWADAEEVKKYDCIEGVKEEVAQTIKYFQKADGA